MEKMIEYDSTNFVSGINITFNKHAYHNFWIQIYIGLIYKRHNFDLAKNGFLFNVHIVLILVY